MERLPPYDGRVLEPSRSLLYTIMDSRTGTKDLHTLCGSLHGVNGENLPPVLMFHRYQLRHEWRQ